jgi:Ca2+-transporting ATPase
VHFLLTGNTGEMVLMLWAALAGWPVPLAAIQILWINLVTDGLPALALGVERPEANLMRCAPRRAWEGVIDWRQGRGILFRGLVLGAVAALGFRIVLEHAPQSLGRAQGTAFGIMAFGQLMLAAGFRSFVTTIPRLGLFTNPWMLGAILVSGLMQLCIMLTPGLRSVFEMESALGWEWLVVFVLSLVPVTVVELGKVFRGRGVG